MEKLSGYVKVRISKTGGKEEITDVQGTEFGLEEGGEWTRDRDDGALTAGFLFIAFREGFDLMLSVNIHGDCVIRKELNIREGDFDEFGIEKVVPVENELDISSIFPKDDDDY